MLTGSSPCFQRSQSSWKRPPVSMFHRGERIFERIHDDLCQGPLLGPVHCVAKAFYQRQGERDGHPLSGSLGTRLYRLRNTVGVSAVDGGCLVFHEVDQSDSFVRPHSDGVTRFCRQRRLSTNDKGPRPDGGYAHVDRHQRSRASASKVAL